MSLQRRERLCHLVKEQALVRGDFTLSSGIRSSFYFDLRMVTLSPEGAYLVGEEIFDLLAEAGAEAVGGLTLGADPIVSAVATASYFEGKPITAFIVRTQPKKHGRRLHIEGPLREGSKVAIVDDVITTGGSVFRAIEAVEAEGCQVVKVVVLLDRQEGGSERLRQQGYDFTALLRSNEWGEVTIA